LKIAVVILNWNGKNLLEKFLPSVIRYSHKANIYVIDNASSDDSVTFLRSIYSEVKVIQNKENYGFSKGYNEGLKKVDAEIICLLNSDVEVTKDWLSPIENLFNKDKNIAVIQPKILDYHKKTHFEYAGAAGGFIDKLGYPYCRGRIFNTIEKDQGQYNDEIEIFWASGAAFFIRKAFYESAGGLDENYFAHQEEIDLCWRLKNRGYKIMYTYKSVVYHIGGATLPMMNPQKTFLNFRNSLYNILKNTSRNKVIFKLFSRLFLDVIMSIYFMLSGKWKHIFAIIKAHLSFYKNLFKIMNKREKKIAQKNHFSHFIAWEYFIMGRKKYTDLKPSQKIEKHKD